MCNTNSLVPISASQTLRLKCQLRLTTLLREKTTALSSLNVLNFHNISERKHVFRPLNMNRVKVTHHVRRHSSKHWFGRKIRRPKDNHPSTAQTTEECRPTEDPSTDQTTDECIATDDLPIDQTTDDSRATCDPCTGQTVPAWSAFRQLTTKEYPPCQCWLSSRNNCSTYRHERNSSPY